MLLGFDRVQPLERMAIEEGPVRDGDQRGQDDAARVYQDHRLERPDGVTSRKRHHSKRHEQYLHQLLRELLPLPIHL